MEQWRKQIIWEYGVLPLVMFGIMIVYHEMGHYLMWMFLHWDSVLLGVQPVMVFEASYIAVAYPFWRDSLSMLLVTSGGMLGTVGFFYFWNRANVSKKALIVLYNVFGLFEIWMRFVGVPIVFGA